MTVEAPPRTHALRQSWFDGEWWCARCACGEESFARDEEVAVELLLAHIDIECRSPHVAGGAESAPDDGEAPTPPVTLWPFERA